MRLTNLLWSGRYIACLYDDNWYREIIMDTCNENNDVKVKFNIIKCIRFCLSWYEYDNQCWVPFQRIICAVTAPHLLGRSDQQYSLEKEDY